MTFDMKVHFWALNWQKMLVRTNGGFFENPFFARGAAEVGKCTGLEHCASFKEIDMRYETAIIYCQALQKYYQLLFYCVVSLVV